MNRPFNPETDYITEHGEVIFNGKVTQGMVESGIQVIQTNDAIGALIDEKRVPIHIAKMREFGVSPDVMGSYVNVPWTDVMSYIGKVVEVIGCAIWFSGEFVPMARPDTVESGYHKVLFKIAETKPMKGVPIGDRAVTMDQNVVIQTSGKRVAEMALVYINAHGWFDWAPGIHEYVLFAGNKDSGYLAQPVNDLVVRIQAEGH
jgi:hypothetical protein